jgi:hypothetical protein
MPRIGALALAATAGVALAAVASATVIGGCKRSKHAHIATYVPPPAPAGFAEHGDVGWRIAVPATWKEAAQRGPALWAVADPQAVDDLHAHVNVVTEPFAGDSYDYARANEAGLRREPRTTVEVAREDVVDGDPTLIIESRWIPTPPSTVAFRTMQGMLASRGTGYVVTCGVSSNAFERYRSTCESILHSFAVQR